MHSNPLSHERKTKLGPFDRLHVCYLHELHCRFDSLNSKILAKSLQNKFQHNERHGLLFQQLPVNYGRLPSSVNPSLISSPVLSCGVILNL